jgi:hypothetical protein
VTVYLTDEELAQLRREAARRRVSLSRHLKERVIPPELEERPVAYSSPTPESERHLVEAVNGVIAGGNRAVLDQLSTLIVMLDQFALSALIHVSEIPEAQKERALTAGARRHRGWQQEVASLLRQLRAQPATEQESAGNGAHT